MSARSVAAVGPARVQGIDVARGLASAIMIQGHAYDGWVRDADKTSGSYLFTRVLGTLPLPSFLLLAGAAIALRIEAADANGESPALVRSGLVRRGLTVFAIGYVVNAVSALMDGFAGPETFFRVDVLHAIGLSIVLIGALGVGGRERIDRRRLVIASVLVALVPILICPPLSTALWDTPAPWSYAVGAITYVPPVTRMPLVPLAAWAGFGVCVSLALVRANRAARSIAGAPTRVLVSVLTLALAVATCGAWLEGWLSERLGVPLDQRSWVVIVNALQLAARGIVVLTVGAIATPYLPRVVREGLGKLGRGSLVAYVIHVPFCYGLLARPIAGRLDMVEATLFVVLLEALGFGAVVLRDAIAGRLAHRRSAA